MRRAKPLARLGPIARLRLAFFVLGALLLLPLALLLTAANDRLEAQRQLRHQVVAERIFDELERELTLLLDSESERPSSAYAQDTSVNAWAPFIVGYFTADSAGTRYVADGQLDADRRARLDKALDEWRSGLIVQPETVVRTDRRSPAEESLAAPPSEASELETSAASFAEARGIRRSPVRPQSESDTAPRQKAAAASPRSSPEVLRQLNRADEQRRQKSAPKAKDPLMDYGY